MRQITFAAILICVLFFGASFVVSKNTGAYFNLIAFTVVFSGTLGATLLSFPLYRLGSALKTVHRIFAGEGISRKEIKDQLIDTAVRAACEGPACYEEIENSRATYPFLRKIVPFIADNYTLQEIQEIMSNQVSVYSFERAQDERLFRRMASLAPAFGVAGSVIGLIGMLMGIGDSELILSQIPIALVSTLYGIVFSNFILTPMAECISADSNEEIMKQKMTFEAVKGMLYETHPYKLARKLEPFSPQESGRDELHLIREKRKAYLYNKENAPISDQEKESLS